VSKLYDQLKKAARTRKQALEAKAQKPAPRAAPASTDPPISGKVLADSDAHWREEIEGKLQEADRDLVSHAPVGEEPEDLRERELTMATLAEAARRRAEAETRALERARERQEAERALHAQSEALLKADLEAAEAAKARVAAERAAQEKARHREDQERVRMPPRAREPRPRSRPSPRCGSARRRSAARKPPRASARATRRPRSPRPRR